MIRYFLVLKVYLRGHLATMMTPVEIKHGYAMKHLLCSVAVGFAWVVHGRPTTSALNAATRLPSLPIAPQYLPSITITRLKQPLTPHPHPPLRQRDELLLYKVIWGKWATQRRWRIARGIAIIGAVENSPCWTWRFSIIQFGHVGH